MERWSVFLLLLLLVGHSSQEMSQELEPGTDPEPPPIFKFDFSHTGGPLIIMGTLLLLTFLKLGFHRYPTCPQSVVLLIVGVAIGLGLTQITNTKEIYMRPSWFFVFLLPLIVLEASFYLKNKDFFNNIGTISIYAVFGTIFNTVCIAFSLYAFKDLYHVKVDLIECFVFASLISAVDPVAVLCVFEDIHVNELLHICVFGESLLNDAVTIVMYHMFMELRIAENMTVGAIEIGHYIIRFLIVAIGGIFTGIVGGFLGAFAMKFFTKEQQFSQPMFCLVWPCIVYLLADTVHLSGILAILACSVIIKNYERGNVGDQARYVVSFVMKALSSYSEAGIFIFLGISAFSADYSNLDYWFMIITLVGITLYRFIGVFMQTFVINKFRREKISWKNQFILAYGGIRGAVCYGLVMSIDGDVVAAKNTMVITTMLVIFFTTIFQGSTIKWLVNKLNIKLSKEHQVDIEGEKLRVSAVAFLQSSKYLTQGISDIVGEDQNEKKASVFRWYVDFDKKYLRPRFCSYPDIDNRKIDHKINEILSETGDVRRGIPTDSSMAHLEMPTNASGIFDVEFNANAMPPPSSCARLVQPPASFKADPKPIKQKGPMSPIPKNESVTGLATEAFAITENQLSIHRQRGRSIYSRHMMPDFGHAASIGSGPDRDSFDDDPIGYLTLPYSHPDRAKLAANIRKFSNSMKDKVPNRLRFASPSRSHSTYHGSSAKSTSSPPNRPTVSFIVENEESGSSSEGSRNGDGGGLHADVASPPQISKGRGRERKINTGTKTFTVGGEENLELLPINEDREA